MIRNLLWLVAGIIIGSVSFAFWHIYYYTPQAKNNIAHIRHLCEQQTKEIAEQVAQLDFEQNNILLFKDAFTNPSERKLGENYRVYTTSCMKSPVLNTEGYFVKAYKDRLFTLNPELVNEAYSRKVEQGAAANP